MTQQVILALPDDEFEAAVDKKLIRVSSSNPWSRVHITSAKGTALFNHDGRKILDFTSGQMSAVVGHSHPEIVAVVREQMEKLVHLNITMNCDAALSAATRLTSMLPPGLDKVMFLSTGSETNEAAIKYSKIYTGGFEVVALSTGFHGMTGGSAAVTFSTGRTSAGPVVPGSFTLPSPYGYRSPFRCTDGSYDWKAELDYGWALIDRQSSNALACVIVEPILSTGGIIPAPEGYLEALKEHCHKRGGLLIFDEAQTGMGRTGYNFAFEHYGVAPDILTISKTLGAGLPLGAVVVSSDVERVCWEKGCYYGSTHMNDPVVCAVGDKVLEMVVRDNFAQESTRKGKILKDGFLALQKKYPVIGDVRGRGLMVGVELVLDPITKQPATELGTAVSDRCMETGLSCNIVNLRGSGGLFRMAPPLTVTDEEIREALEIFGAALEYCLEKTKA